jgi:hypothetical protein
LLHREGACDDKQNRSFTNDGVEAISLVFPPRLVHKAPRLPTPISTSGAQHSASGAVSRCGKSPVLNIGGQMLTFQGKTCSHFRSFTNGCLEQDSDGYWWIRIDHTNTKMSKDHRIPTRASDGVLDAIRRQGEPVRNLPNHFGAHYLFRTEQGLLPRMTFSGTLKKLALSLQHEGRPYLITPPSISAHDCQRYD